MDDALLVRRFERVGDLFRDRQRFVERNRAARDALRQILALDQFHHERVTPACPEASKGCSLESVDGGDVRVIQGGEGLRFAFEAGHAFRIGGEHVGQDLDRDLPAEARVGSAVDLSHASCADGCDNLIDAEPGSRRESQSCSYCLCTGPRYRSSQLRVSLIASSLSEKSTWPPG